MQRHIGMLCVVPDCDCSDHFVLQIKDASIDSRLLKSRIPDLDILLQCVRCVILAVSTPRAVPSVSVLVVLASRYDVHLGIDRIRHRHKLSPYLLNDDELITNLSSIREQ